MSKTIITVCAFPSTGNVDVIKRVIAGGEELPAAGGSISLTEEELRTALECIEAARRERTRTGQLGFAMRELGAE